MLVEAIVSALIPAAAEAVKGLVSKLVGGVKPLTIDDQIKLDQSEITKLEAVSKLDNPGGTPSQWVIDLRASARYVAAGFVIIGATIAIFTPIEQEVKLVALEAANIVFGFLFGSRIVANWRK